MYNFKKIIKNTIKTVFSNIPVIGKRFDAMLKAYQSSAYPPGHYHSTIPSLEEVKNNETKIFDNDSIAGIDLRVNEQLALLEQLKEHYKKLLYNFDETQNEAEQFRYQTKDSWYRYSDAIFLHCMLLQIQPRNIIEVGSGHSSAVMLDSNEFLLDGKIKFTFIEPYPENRLLNILKEKDKENSSVIKSFIQDINLSLFKELKENDILFIDSTHVSKVGSDVNFIFFELLPIIPPGVFIHFHDIFYPFELPKHWIYEKKWFWNEVYMLRAFLMDNPNYEIILFNTLLQKKYRTWFEKEMPKCLLGESDAGSIWLRKIK